MYDCGLYANAVEYCLTEYTGGLHIKFDQIPFVRSHPTIFCMPSVSPQSQFVSIIKFVDSTFTGTSKVSPEQRTRVQMIPEAQNDI
jgi:hypothetical protein